MLLRSGRRLGDFSSTSVGLAVPASSARPVASSGPSLGASPSLFPFEERKEKEKEILKFSKFSEHTVDTGPRYSTTIVFQGPMSKETKPKNNHNKKFLASNCRLPVLPSSDSSSGCLRRWWSFARFRKFLLKQSIGTVVVLKGVAISGELLQVDLTIDGKLMDEDVRSIHGQFLHVSFVYASRQPASAVLLDKCRKEGSVGKHVAVRYYETGNHKMITAHGRVIACLSGGRLLVEYFTSKRRYLLPPPASAPIAVCNIWFYDPRRYPSDRTSSSICGRNVQPAQTMAASQVVAAPGECMKQKGLGNSALRISSLNCRSLRCRWRRLVLARDFCRSPSLCALQETRLDEVPPEFASIANVVCVPATPCSKGPNLRGGLLVLIPRNFAQPTTSLFEDRAVSLLFKGSPGLRFTAVYAPQSGLGREVVAGFWLRLGEWLKDLRDSDGLLPRPAIHVMVGDFNADVGTSGQAADLLNHSNMCVAAFCALLDLHKKSFTKSKPQFTYISNRGENSSVTTIDHILIDARFRSSLENCSVVNNNIGSDHRCLVGRLRVHLRRPKRSNTVSQLDWSAIPSDFSARVFSAINDLLAGPRLLEGAAAAAGLPWFAVSPSYSDFVKAARLCAPRRPPRVGSAPSAPPRIRIRSVTDVKIAKAVTCEEATAVMRSFISLSQTHPSRAWQEVKRLTSAKAKSSPTASSDDEILKFFQSVNGAPRAYARTAPFRVRQEAAGLVADCNFTQKEVATALSQLHPGRAKGMDELPVEVLRMPEFSDLILRLSNDFLDGNVPLEVLLTRLVLVPKKGDKSIVSNYRGVAITSVFLKLLNRLILNRLRVLDDILRTGQNGFRPGRGTSSHVLALGLLAETFRSSPSGSSAPSAPTAVLFVDFAKAFDSVSFSAIADALAAFQVPRRLMTAIMSCYRHGHKSHAMWVELVAKSYELQSGVLQGDTLAPYLFVLILDCLLDEAVPPALHLPLSPCLRAHESLASQRYNLRPRRNQPTGKHLGELGFADDLAFPAVDCSTVKIILHRLQSAARNIGLELNLGRNKTEILLLTPDDADRPEPILDIDGRPVPYCRDYKYLGSRPFNLARGLSERISLTWVAIRRFLPLWQALVPLKLKLQLLRSLCTSILLYGCEVWTPKIGFVADRAYAHMLRYVLGVTRTSFHFAEIDMFAIVRLPHISSIAVERQLILIGHALRSNCALHQVLNHTLKVDLRSAALHRCLRHRIPYPREDWDILASDRPGWKLLARTAAHAQEEKVQHSLLRLRRARWTSLPRIENRVFLYLAEDLQYSNFFVSRACCGHWVRPFSMRPHYNPFGDKNVKESQ
jgi:exonuclease III